MFIESQNINKSTVLSGNMLTQVKHMFQLTLFNHIYLPNHQACILIILHQEILPDFRLL